MIAGVALSTGSTGNALSGAGLVSRGAAQTNPLDPPQTREDSTQ